MECLLASSSGDNSPRITGSACRQGQSVHVQDQRVCFIFASDTPFPLFYPECPLSDGQILSLVV